LYCLNRPFWNNSVAEYNLRAAEVKKRFPYANLGGYFKTPLWGINLLHMWNNIRDPQVALERFNKLNLFGAKIDMDLVDGGYLALEPYCQ